ncbi:MAG: CheR family methyltransferase, partial [Candidatus Didemnitutus sp.]|nr:CheR family methyltransferase [Candidatus Didemnitutus sp.]
LPDLADWHVTILATDINARFLRKAVAGSYGEWSFRDAPEGLRERYFNRSSDGRHVVAPEIKAMVTFGHLNLVEDVYPSLATDTNAMDVILCRNVLMYFSPEQIRRVIGKFRHALLDGGWLLVSPSEASQELFSRFATRNFPGVILYQKSDAHVGGAGLQSAVSPISNRPGADPGWNSELGESSADWKPATPQTASLRSESPRPEPSAPAQTRPTPYAVAGALYEQGRYDEAADTLLASLAGHTPESPVFSLLARALANQGRLAEALTWCDRWIAADKLDSAAHYLRAVVLLEQGGPEEARRSLQRAVYLRHDFVLAHFALGNLARGGGKAGEAGRHFGNARQLLARLQPDDPLPESDGLTAGRLLETITALTALENTR